jgi:hypothetical protein
MTKWIRVLCAAALLTPALASPAAAWHGSPARSYHHRGPADVAIGVFGAVLGGLFLDRLLAPVVAPPPPAYYPASPYYPPPPPRVVYPYAAPYWGYRIVLPRGGYNLYRAPRYRGYYHGFRAPRRRGYCR